jgi:hypothetical protein
MAAKLDGKNILLTQDIKILGFIVPILIMSPSGELTGSGNVFAEASWEGTDWNTEIGKTIVGQGEISLKDGTLNSEDVLSRVLKPFGKSETLEFKEIKVPFSLKEGKIINDNIQVNSKDLKFGLKGWTSLVYEPSRKGNPMEYMVTGELIEKALGKEAQKYLSPLGIEEGTIPVAIAGTVQKPRISIKLPKAGDLLKGLFKR